MSRPSKIIRPVRVHTTFPEDLLARLDLFLWSPLENRLPLGARQKFLVERTQEYFDSASLDVSLYRTVAGNPIIRGSSEAIEAVKNALALSTVEVSK